jgi:hypothetical protein
VQRSAATIAHYGKGRFGGWEGKGVRGKQKEEKKRTMHWMPSILNKFIHPLDAVVLNESNNWFTIAIKP